MADRVDDRVITALAAVPPAARGCVLAIGNFDGVHVGHRRIIERACELARAAGSPVVAMTFEPPPDRVLRPAEAPLRVVPPDVRSRLLLAAGCDWVVVLRADRRLLSLSPRQFIRRVIIEHLSPRHIVEGPNFTFGRGRGGTVETLRRSGAEAGFAVDVVEPLRMSIGGEQVVVSSTLIRRLVADGRVADAARCLGRDYTLYGRIVRGRGVGRLLEYPTANLAAGRQVCPADGVYAGRAEIEGENFAAAISIGARPTFGDEGGRWTIEAFLLDASGDFYGRRMALSFTRRLRPQRRYETVDALKAQLDADVRSVRRICGRSARA
ncbi:MAG: bifunctional riboflavin kinase/FAD synthetase [Planctomycetes bacterium]|nr:bifunctional riboflavin kinase/FAD synthetase [Planctomycetota bacterium]